MPDIPVILLPFLVVSLTITVWAVARKICAELRWHVYTKPALNRLERSIEDLKANMPAVVDTFMTETSKRITVAFEGLRLDRPAVTFHRSDDAPPRPQAEPSEALKRILEASTEHPLEMHLGGSPHVEHRADIARYN